MDGWNTTFLLGRPIFRGYVSFREGTKNDGLENASPFKHGVILGYQEMVFGGVMANP